jgi:excisionase family DNA binding protein
MLTVPDAARRVRKDPETVRRWIRSGRLRSRKIGTQHVIDEADLDALIQEAKPLPLPRQWRRTITGDPMPDWASIVRRSREGR